MNHQLELPGMRWLSSGCRLGIAPLAAHVQPLTKGSTIFNHKVNPKSN